MSEKVWFVEVPRMGGGWSPQLHWGDRPPSTNSEGAFRRFRAEPVEIRPEDLNRPIKDVSLEELQRIYGGGDDTKPIYRGDISEAPRREGPAWEARWLANELRGPDGEPTSEADKLDEFADMLDELQAELDKAHDLLREMAAQKLGSEMEYPMNADWREGYETFVRKARALVGTEGE